MLYKFDIFKICKVSLLIFSQVNQFIIHTRIPQGCIFSRHVRPKENVAHPNLGFSVLPKDTTTDKEGARFKPPTLWLSDNLFQTRKVS